MRTQELFSKLFGVSERYVYYLFKGERSFTPRLAKKVEDKLGIPRMQLLYPSEHSGREIGEIIKRHLILFAAKNELTQAPPVPTQPGSEPSAAQPQ